MPKVRDQGRIALQPKTDKGFQKKYFPYLKFEEKQPYTNYHLTYTTTQNFYYRNGVQMFKKI